MLKLLRGLYVVATEYYLPVMLLIDFHLLVDLVSYFYLYVDSRCLRFIRKIVCNLSLRIYTK